MKKIELKTRKWLRGIFMGSSLTATAFIFQACYGQPGDFGQRDGFDVNLSGKVKSKTTNVPMQGIKVGVQNSQTYSITDENGNFSFYAFVQHYQHKNDSTTTEVSINKLPVYFADIDSTENGGWFADKQIIINYQGQDAVKINVELEKK